MEDGGEGEVEDQYNTIFGVGIIIILFSYICPLLFYFKIVILIVPNYMYPKVDNIVLMALRTCNCAIIVFLSLFLLRYSRQFYKTVLTIF